MRKKGKKTAGNKRLGSKTTDKVRALLEEISSLQSRQDEEAKKLERFTERDLPEFTAWLEENHSAKRKKLSEILNETEILQISFEEALYAYDNGKFRSEADAVVAAEKEVRREYEKLAKAEADSSSPGRPPDAVIDALFESFLSEVKGLDPDELDGETYERYRADFSATFDHVREGDRAAFEKAILRLAAADTAEDKSAAKVVFRRLVRRLHPDQHPDFGEFEKALWNEAMICYELSDAEGLETIELRFQIHLREAFSPAQTPALRRYRDQLKSRWLDLENSLGESQLHPAWEFSLKRKTKALLKSMEREFEGAILEAEHRLRNLKSVFNEAKTRATRVRKVRSPKKKTQSKKKPSAKKTTPRPPTRRTKPPEQRAVQEEFPF